MLYVVKYTGPFGYLKPWTAVRDGETYSQQFLTPSVIEGMRQKLGVSAILRYRLSYDTLSQQQEVVHARAFKENRRGQILGRDRGIILRNVLLNPVLHLAFPTRKEAETAARQHLCLCRNEDVVLPVGLVQEVSEEDFAAIDGFELQFTADGSEDGSFLVGFNRFADNAPMYGQLFITGRAVRYLPQS